LNRFEPGLNYELSIGMVTLSRPPVLLIINFFTMKPILSIFLLAGLLSQEQASPQTQTSAQTRPVIPFDSSHWTIRAQSATEEEHFGRQGLKLTNGTALLKEAGFTNGIIEFDIALQHERYFPGIAFRMQDMFNGEDYYLRPHQSGNPDAMQYYPQYHGEGSWQLYYGEGYNKAHSLPFDRWLHIRIVVSGGRAEVYFDDEKEPALYMAALKRPVAPGMIALKNAWPVPAWYANFSCTRMDSVSLLNPPRPAPVLPPTVFTRWQVSDPFDETRVTSAAGHTALTLPDIIDTTSIHWQTLTTDERGVADFSRLAGVAPGKNTVFARLVIESDHPQVKKFLFGFSDRVKIYCNNRLLYAGEDNYQSRDYRFLGTIGYFDALYLELKKGRNELWMAVSETSGGWGVKASLEDH
jgi:hypothetical protein